MKSLLSTRVLKPAQSEQLRQAGWDLTQYDAISVKLLPVNFQPGNRWAIFTSRHAVRACLHGARKLAKTNLACLCVGEKTAELLREKGVSPLEVARNAAELADRIKNKYTNKSFVYYCGNRRLDLLPECLDSIGASWQEEVVYETTLAGQKFHKSFHAALFFSPSGVESYFEANQDGNTLALCIGATTAAAAKKYTDRFEIAEHPSAGELIALAEDQIRSVKP